VNKYADLEFLSLADRIASDYKSLLEKISGLNDAQDSPINLLAFRVLVEIHQSEEPLSAEDIAALMRLDSGRLSRALVRLIGLEYVTSTLSKTNSQDKVIHLTAQGQAIAQKYESYIDQMVEEKNEMSPLLLSETERDRLILSLIDLQNRSAGLLEKMS
jgi:DNA-binding MarR family transcriptional regulator